MLRHCPFDPATNKSRVTQFHARLFSNRLTNQNNLHCLSSKPIRDGSLVEFPRALILGSHANNISALGDLRPISFPEARSLGPVPRMLRALEETDLSSHVIDS